MAHLIEMEDCMKRITKLILGGAVLGAFSLVTASMVPLMGARAEAPDWKYGLGDAIGFNESTYATIEKGTKKDSWREGSVTANGEIAFIESCDPDEDVFIFNNTKIVTDGTDIYETPNISDILDSQREGAVTRTNTSDFPWVNAVNKYASSVFGTSWGTTWSRPYQPASQYRIKNNSFTDANKDNYNRYTNYETGEVGAQWKDADGNEWNRRSFASRSDDVIVTYIEAPDNQDLDITLSIDHMVEMRNQGSVNPRPDSDYIVTQDDNGYTMGMVGKYPDQYRKGSKNRTKTLFSNGGWGSATRIVTDGTIDYQADTRTLTNMNGFGSGTITNANDPKINITGTKSIMLITKVDRQDDGCNTVQDVKEQLYDRLISEIDSVVTKYEIKSNNESYKKLLDPHVKIHGGMFDNVRIDLCQTEDEKADRKLTNKELISKQNASKSEINKAFLERIYNNGRFGLICASGYHTTRLGAIWTGAWKPDWSGDFTLDANTNLQVSGMNTGNMASAGEGYINFIVRMVADWETDAQNVYGMTDAIKAPPRVDGTGQAGSYHFLDGYPHLYVNGITDWLIIPIFEYWQCYGDQEIPLGKDIDLERNQHVLDWSDEDVERIRSTGKMKLVEDILYPMLDKTMNFWLQYVDERYYTDGSGNNHLDDGTTLSEAIAAGDTEAKYLYTPGYSPENSPEGAADNSIYALTYNTTMDISATHDTLFMARAILDVVKPSDAADKLMRWNTLESRIPEYLYADTGELKEWATKNLGEKHRHRHVSHAYPAWPGYESQTDENLRVGILKAMSFRSAAYGGKEASESHGPTHKALVAARLKDSESLDSVLRYLMTSNYQYSSMMTSHNDNHSSTYCTDSAFGIMGAVNESLLYSNTGEIEVLPALLDSMGSGSITGLRARCNAEVDNISWDIAAKKVSVTVTSDQEHNKIALSCGPAWSEAKINGAKQVIRYTPQDKAYILLEVNKNESITAEFTLGDQIRISTSANIDQRVHAGDNLEFTADYTSLTGEAGTVSWHVTDAINNQKLDDANISAEGKFTVPESAKGRMLKIFATSSDGSAVSNEIILNVSANSAGSSDTEEAFMAYAGLERGHIGLCLSNNGQSKKIRAVWTAYDSSDAMVDLSEQIIELGANEYKKLSIPAQWNSDIHHSSVFLWDADSLVPYMPQLPISLD